MEQCPTLYQRVAGCLLGQAYGDAFAMPAELWPQQRVRAHFGWINTFVAGPKENSAANEFKRGQFTDDTAQALAMLDAIFAQQGVIDPKQIAKYLIAWAKSADAFNKNILGPTSKQSLLAIEQGADIDSIDANGVTNGAAMRVAPLGCLLTTTDINQFIEQVRLACLATHKSDIAIAGAVAIAYATSCATQGMAWRQIVDSITPVVDLAQTKYASTFSPSLSHRISYAIACVESLPATFSGTRQEGYQQICATLYQQVGAGMDMIESVPTALALVQASNTDPLVCAELAANLGGDTDTIGAMACAICGALNGAQAFPAAHIELLTTANQTDFSHYASAILALR